LIGPEFSLLKLKANWENIETDPKETNADFITDPAW
jgi:hypothetical protein